MHCELPQCITIVCLQPVAALVVIYLAVMTLQTQSTAPTVAGCCLVGCSVISGRSLCSHTVVGVSRHVCVCLGGVFGGEEEGGGVRSGPGEDRTILLLHIISVRPSKQPLNTAKAKLCFCKNNKRRIIMERTFLKVYGAWLLFFVSERTNKRHHHHYR